MILEKIEKELIEGKNFDANVQELDRIKAEVKRLIDLTKDVRRLEWLQDAQRRKDATTGYEILGKLKIALNGANSKTENYTEFMQYLSGEELHGAYPKYYIYSAEKYINITESEYNKINSIRGFIERREKLYEHINHDKVNELQRHYNEVNFKNK